MADCRAGFTGHRTTRHHLRKRLRGEPASGDSVGDAPDGVAAGVHDAQVQLDVHETADGVFAVHHDPGYADCDMLYFLELLDLTWPLSG